MIVVAAKQTTMVSRSACERKGNMLGRIILTMSSRRTFGTEGRR